MKNKKTRKFIQYILIVLFGLLGAIDYNIFVFPNAFAPSGINGIATMIQYLFHFSVGYMSLIINIPLFILTFFLCDKEFAIKNMIYVVSFSVFILLFNNVIDISRFEYGPEVIGYVKDVDGNAIRVVSNISLVLGPLAAGVINGFIYGNSMKMNSSTGGTDYIARILRKYHPRWNFVWTIFCLNVCVAIASYFVYGYRFEPVICCIIYCLTTSMISDLILRGSKSAIKFEVVTDKPKEMAEAIINELRHDATVIEAEGMYTHADKSLLICIINKRQVSDFQEMLMRFPGSFAYMTSVNETVGNFRRDITKKEVEEAKSKKIESVEIIKED